MDRTPNPSSSAAAATTAAADVPPTTYVHADAATFRDLVQRLTGAAPAAQPPRPAVAPRRAAFKLQERRGRRVRDLEVHLRLRSPSLLRAESSPVTPLGSDPLFSPAAPSGKEEEDRAIAEKGFYLHPSPRGASAAAACEPPELLPLFPLCSPKQQPQLPPPRLDSE